MDKELKVMLGVPSAGFIRNSLFLDYYGQLEKPAGTLITSSHGASPANGRNGMIKMALEQNCTHILFMDDDMAPEQDSLMRLLKHDLDIVGALYLMRNYPHFPLAFDEAWEDGQNRHMLLTPDTKGLVEVTNTGLGFCLIKTDVFRKMEGPYWIRLGEIQPDGWCDDIGFFNRVRQAGFKIFVDTDCKVGHLSQMILYPNYSDGRWHTMYKTAAIDGIQVPQIVPLDD